MPQTSDRYLCFSLGSEQFALPLLQVREVIARPGVTPIPQSPPYCLGVMNLRGKVITILDLRKKFAVAGQDGPELSAIITEIGSASVGLIVDRINYVLSPKEGEISDKPAGVNSKLSEAILGVHRHDKNLILLLDLHAALQDVPLASLGCAA